MYRQKWLVIWKCSSQQNNIVLNCLFCVNSSSVKRLKFAGKLEHGLQLPVNWLRARTAIQAQSQKAALSSSIHDLRTSASVQYPLLSTNWFRCGRQTAVARCRWPLTFPFPSPTKTCSICSENYFQTWFWCNKIINNTIFRVGKLEIVCHKKN